MNPCRTCQKPFEPSAFRQDKRRRNSWNSKCRKCESLAGAKWAKDNAERAAEGNRRRREANLEHAKAVRKAHYERNKERVLAQAAVYRAANAERERANRKAHYERNKQHVLAAASEYRKANKPKVNSWQRKYQTKKRSAIPAWADLQKIEKIYETAAWMSENSGEPWHVDHIVPIQGKTVCGLHCEANLTILPATENMSKSNRYWPDMWETTT